MKTMKNTICAILLLSAPAYGSFPVQDGQQQHLESRHCEFFIDRVDAFYDPYGYGPRIHLYLKTLNDRIDSTIAEVGFKHKKVTTWFSYNGDQTSSETTPNWLIEFAKPYFDANNYWHIELPMEYVSPGPTSKSFIRYDYQGAFYVKSTKGTFYWIHPRTDAKDLFLFNEIAFRTIWNMRPAINHTTNEIQFAQTTQNSIHQDYYNSNACY